MTLDLRTLLAVALIVGGFLLPQGGEIVVPTPAPVPVEVSVDLPVADIPRDDRDDLAGFYDAMADAVKNDGDKGGEKLIKDTADFRERHVAALRFARSADKVGVYPGLGEAIDAVFAERLGGLDVMPVSDEVRAKIIEACRDLAEGFRHG